MTMLSTRQLRYFETLAETLHFGRAARHLNISQPALSAQIAQMEDRFGAALLERRPSGLTLTPEGLAVQKRVRRIMAELRDLEALANTRDGLLTGRLKLGVIASVAPYLLPSLLPILASDFPDLNIGVRESVTATLLEELARGDIDCAVIASAIQNASLRSLPLLEEPFFLAVAEAERDRFVEPVEVGQLGSERLILLEEGHCLRDQALNVCALAGADELSRLGATSLSTLLRMVAGGLGVTLVPRMAADAERDGTRIAFLSLAAPVPARPISLVFRASSARERDFETLRSTLLAALQPRS